jgi:hypothetical protein
MEILTGLTFTQNKKVEKLSVFSSLMSTEDIVKRMIRDQTREH